MDFASSSSATTPAGAFSERTDARSHGHNVHHQDEEQKRDRDDVEMVDDEATRANDERLGHVRQRIAAYEQCVDAMGVVTASLEELSTKIEAMKLSTQQLNAFTSGWLTVWKRA